MNNNDIVIRIRTGLRHKRMSQRDLAAALEKKAEISRWMSGRMGISEMNLQRIEDILEVPLTAESIARQQSNYLRIGVIGTGSIAKRFAQEMAYVDKVYLAAAYNPDEEELKKYCDEFGIANESHSLEDMFRVVDAIYIASPYYTHYEYALAALEADRHVLCETPLTLSHKEALELYTIAEKRGLILMPALKTAYSQSFVNVINEALSGAIGEIVDVSATVTTLLPQSVTVGFNNERLQDNAYYGLLAVFKLLGTEYKKVSTFTRTDDAKDLYIDATLEYEDAVAHVRAGTGVKSEDIIPGNDAAELIKALMENHESKVGNIRPTFEEYLNRLPDEMVITFVSQNE